MNIKYTIKQLNDYIFNRGYKLLSTEYKNNKSKLRFECPNNHIFEMVFNNFQQGQVCPNTRARLDG